MGKFVEKIFGQKAGSIVTVEPDYVVINDGVSAGAVSQIASVAYPDRVLVIYDHDVPTGRPEAANVLRKNLAFARKYGCRYIQAVGVGYQYMLNEVVKPGQIVVGGGSHSSIFGAKGALGINVSVPELARIVETGRYSVVVPETVTVGFTGSLKNGVGAMDAAFAFLKAAGDSIKRKAVEFCCPSFSQHCKEVLCSMACMSGAYTASVIDVASTAIDITVNLSDLTPLVMMPCADRSEQGSAEIKPVSEVSVLLNAGQIGGYTGGTIEELRKAAAIIDGQKIAFGFRLSICPATSRDYILAMEEGLITKFIDFGAQINAVGDHSVVVQGPGAMGPKETLVTTGLYTFTGAMGVESSLVYSANTETVAKASLSRKL